jgi:hypothetical protein
MKLNQHISLEISHAVKHFSFDFILLLMANITYNTCLEKDLVKKFKILNIEHDKRQNDFLEEAIRDVLKKYEQVKKPRK